MILHYIRRIDVSVILEDKMKSLKTLLTPLTIGLIFGLAGCYADSGYYRSSPQYANNGGYVDVAPNVSYVNSYPPAAYQETMTASPGYGHVWVQGYWDWSGQRWNWRGGHWTQSQQNQVWVAPYYDYSGGRYVYRRGYWSARNRAPRGRFTRGNGYNPSTVYVPPRRPPPRNTNPGRRTPPRRNVAPGRRTPPRAVPPVRRPVRRPVARPAQPGRTAPPVRRPVRRPGVSRPTQPGRTAPPVRRPIRRPGVSRPTQPGRTAPAVRRPVRRPVARPTQPGRKAPAVRRKPGRPDVKKRKSPGYKGTITAPRR